MAVPATETSELAKALGDNRRVVEIGRFCARDGRTPNAGTRVKLWGKSRTTPPFEFIEPFNGAQLDTATQGRDAGLPASPPAFSGRNGTPETNLELPVAPLDAALTAQRAVPTQHGGRVKMCSTQADWRRGVLPLKESPTRS